MLAETIRPIQGIYPTIEVGSYLMVEVSYHAILEGMLSTKPLLVHFPMVREIP